MNGVTRPSDSAGSNQRRTIEMPWARVIWPDGASTPAVDAPNETRDATATRTSTQRDRLRASIGEPVEEGAAGAGTVAGWGTGDTHGAAERSAVAACNSQGRGCEARVWSCNAPGETGNEAFAPTKMCRYWDGASQQYVTRFCSSTR